MKPLIVVDARQPEAVHDALRVALAGGPAVNPRLDDRAPSDVPAEVDDDVALVIETSGSTGRPKRVALSAGALLESATAADAALEGPGQWLLALPAHYVAGTNVLVRSIVAETECQLLGPGHFSPDAFFAAAERLTGSTRYSALVPAQLGSLLDAAERNPAAAEILASFSAVLVGGQSTSTALLSRARETRIRVVRTYGSSETSGGCVYEGRPIGSTRVAVVDGELWLSGPSLALGYLGDPLRTAAAFVVRDGVRWYRTGDLGEVDESGAVSVQGRLDDVIISGGEKVSLSVVERAIREMPGLSEAVVVRTPHDRWGEVPVVVVPRGRVAMPPLADVRQLIGTSIGRAASPSRVLVVEALPLLPSGKVDRVAVARLVARA